MYVTGKYLAIANATSGYVTGLTTADFFMHTTLTTARHISHHHTIPVYMQ